MRVRNFMLAEAIAGRDGYHVIHGAGFTGLNVQRFPYTHQKVSLYVTLVREAQDTAGGHRLQVELLDPDLNKLEALADGQIELPSEPDGDDPLLITYVGQCAGIGFPRQGIYSITLSVDGVELDRMTIAVGDHTKEA